MAVINRVLNILILILAIVAVVFAYQLAAHRQHAKDRADKYAEKLAAVAATLDTNTGTNVKADVTKDKLAWKSYDKDPAGVNKALDSLTGQAATVQKQRDDLGAAVATLNTTLGGEEIKAGELQNAKTFTDKVATVQKTATLIGERDQAVATGLEALAAKIEVNVTKGDLSSTAAETYTVPLKNIADKAGKQFDNNLRMKTTLSYVVDKVEKSGGEELGFRPEDIETQPEDKVEKLRKGVDTMVLAVAESQALKKRVDTLTAQKKELEDKFTDTTNAKTELEGKFAALQTKYDLVSKPGTVAAPVDNGPKAFDGKVVKVNYDWNYVVIGLGAKDGLPANVDMIVARDREYIATVHVSTIYSNYSVADVVPRLKKGEIIDGDRVYYQVAAAEKPTTAAAISLVPAMAAPAAPAAPAEAPAPAAPREVIGVGIGR